MPTLPNWVNVFINYSVLIGLVPASIWVWAIVIDKFVLFGRTRKSMDRFEQAFWSGQSSQQHSCATILIHAADSSIVKITKQDISLLVKDQVIRTSHPS